MPIFCSLYYLHIIIIIIFLSREYIYIKQLFKFIILNTISFIHAANETSSIYTSKGQLISLGDNFTDIYNRFKLSPNSRITP